EPSASVIRPCTEEGFPSGAPGGGPFSPHPTTRTRTTGKTRFMVVLQVTPRSREWLARLNGFRVDPERTSIIDRDHFTARARHQGRDDPRGQALFQERDVAIREHHVRAADVER